ncbi:MAG: MOSC domain-containing protein [Tranquillimonas sp.]
MTAAVAQIWRHPVKGHGAEPVARTVLVAGATLPGDRVWAVAHEASAADGSSWAPCTNFSRGAKAPGLMAVGAMFDDGSGRLTLSHPDRPDLSLHPETEGDRLIDWARPLMPEGRAASARVIRVPGRGMTDTDYPSVSILSLSSLEALSRLAGVPLDPRRFRGNVWLDGVAPWEEFTWIGRRLRLGQAVVELRERITRCRATMADPLTGRIDVDTLALLQTHFGHRDFGVYGVVIEGGSLSRGDRAELLP